MNSFDVLVIGGGQGAALARYLAKDGMRVALFERTHWGGVCINSGCTPVKTLGASARAAYEARRSAEFGVLTGEVSIDWPRVRERMETNISNFRHEVEEHLHIKNLTLVCGEARFTAPKTVEANGESYTAEKIVIATGTRNARPPIEGLEDVPYLDSSAALALDEIPSHLLIVGGGYIALELGQAFLRLGSQVTVVETAPHVLIQEDPDIAEELTQILRDEGIEFLLGAHAKQLREENGIALDIECDGKTQTLRGSHVLVATGRRPNTDDLGCDAAGIELDKKGFIAVDDGLKTSVDGVYALGDVANSPQFVHIAFDDVRLLRAHLCGGEAVSTRDRLIAYAVFTDPQLGRVGMNEKEAREKFGDELRVATLPASDTARGVETGQVRGVFKAFVGPNDEILGATILAAEGGEIMSVVHAAMLGKLPFTALRDASWAHPLWAESLNLLFLDIDGCAKDKIG
ncbi:MAG TPA: mercuric reductase [Abditibacteriaceae bacterium]|jgi:pyruvate/2-oxoglutarate dehydrogenase complex dihydrolipoamide dehydrogenase (E3) component